MTFIFLTLQKVHTFQKSVEAVMLRLGDAERAQQNLSNTTMATMTNGGAATESEIQLFRNQLKVSVSCRTSGSPIKPTCCVKASRGNEGLSFQLYPSNNGFSAFCLLSLSDAEFQPHPTPEDGWGHKWPGFRFHGELRRPLEPNNVQVGGHQHQVNKQTNKQNHNVSLNEWDRLCLFMAPNLVQRLNQPVVRFLGHVFLFKNASWCPVEVGEVQINLWLSGKRGAECISMMLEKGVLCFAFFMVGGHHPT